MVLVEPTPEPVADEQPRSVKLLKGCGCVTGLVGLALGILIIGNFDMGAWASALGAVVIGTLVFMMSGTNGFWER